MMVVLLESQPKDSFSVSLTESDYYLLKRRGYSPLLSREVEDGYIDSGMRYYTLLLDSLHDLFGLLEWYRLGVSSRCYEDRNMVYVSLVRNTEKEV